MPADSPSCLRIDAGVAQILFSSHLSYDSMDCYETTVLAGIQHAGMLLGMFAKVSPTLTRTRHVLHRYAVMSCLSHPLLCWPLVEWQTGQSTSMSLFYAANGSFAVAAIGGMMMSQVKDVSNATDLNGLVGAAQAISFAMGGFLGTVVDITVSG